MGKAQPEKYGDIKTIRDERHPLDSMTEEQKMAATLELVAKVRARLDQARALDLLPPKTTDAECDDVTETADDVPEALTIKLERFDAAISVSLEIITACSVHPLPMERFSAPCRGRMLLK